jgi:hypothetical protein
MNMRRGVLSLGAGLVLLLGVSALFYQGTVRAQVESEEISTVNAKIDCSTNPSYDNKYIASAFRAGGGHAGGSNRQCNACHAGNSPRVGMGDKPITRYGTALIHNRLATTVSYSVRFGKKGEWESYELKPGAVRRHSYKYSRPNQNRSPEAWIKFHGPKDKDVEKRLSLLATPNVRLGAVYFFERDDKDRLVYLWEPGHQVGRR